MEKKTFNIIVPKNYQVSRIDKFLQLTLKEISRTKLQSFIIDGYVKVNNKKISETSKKIHQNDKIEVCIPPPKETIACFLFISEISNLI